MQLVHFAPGSLAESVTLDWSRRPLAA